MGSPISSNKGGHRIVYGSEGNSFELLQRVASPSLNAVPISKESIDGEGNYCQLWALSNDGFLGTVRHPNGKVSIIPSDKIHVPSSSNSLQVLLRIKNTPTLSFDIAHISKEQKFVLFPHMRAAGRDDQINNLAQNVFKPKEYLHKISEDPSKVGHIFRNRPGHFVKDTPENRAYILAAVSDPRNLAITTKRGKKVYVKVMPDQGEAWAHVSSKTGLIHNGGRSPPWIRWRNDEDKLSGGEARPVSVTLLNEKVRENQLARLARRLTPLFHKAHGKPDDPSGGGSKGGGPKGSGGGGSNPAYESFKDRVRANGLVKSYNASHPDHPMSEGKGKGEIGGVGNETGIILGLFDDLSGKLEQEHTFFLPAPGGISLSEEEIQRVMQELALGIFVHDTIPFFSLHFNGDTNMYPVIHPAYQNTFVGHVISMLDYYMKGFLNGGFFPETFVWEWNRNQKMEEQKLKQGIVDVRDYCREHLGESYHSIREFTTFFEQIEALKFSEKKIDPSSLPIEGLSEFFEQMQISKSAKKVEEDPILKDYSGFRSSFRIIAHQKGIKKVEDLFILDGDFDVLYTITPDAAYQQELAKYRTLTGEDPPSYRRLEKAYDAMCGQIKKMMPRFPAFKKLFEALNLINFFCHYFNTLKKAGKFPLLSQRVFKRADGSPPLFPHLPLRAFYRETIALKLSELFQYQQRRSLIEESLLEDNHLLGVEHLAEWIQRAVLTKARYPLSKEQKESGFYKEIASVLFENLKKAILKAKTNQLSQFDSFIRQKMISNAMQCVFNRNTQVRFPSSEEIATVRADFERQLERRPLDVLNLDTSIDLPLIHPDSLLHPYSEHKLEEERQLQKRIVGGCAIALDQQPIQLEEGARSFLDRHFKELFYLFNEEVLEVSNEENRGVFFKVRFGDFPLISDDEKEVALESLSPSRIEKDPLLAAIWRAIETSDETLFQKAAKEMTEWDFQDSRGVSLLHLAARIGNPTILDRVSEKISPFIRDAQGYTPLHYAAQEGHLEAIDLLLSKAPELINKQALGGETALYVATQHEKLEALQALLDKRANPNCRTAHGMNALMCAIYREFVPLALKLLDQWNIEVQWGLDDETTALHLAVESKGMQQVIERMIAKKIDVNQPRWDRHTPLHLAAKGGHFSYVELLAKAPRIDLNATLKSGKTAIHLAAQNDQYGIVEHLLQKGADPLLFGWDRETTLITATRNGSIYSAICLLSFVKNKTVLVEGKKERFINVKDRENRTALEIAAKLRMWDLWFSLFNPAQDDPKKTALEPIEHLLLLCHPGVHFNSIRAFMNKHWLNRDEDRLKALTTCAKNGHTVAVSALYKKEDAKTFRDSNGWSIADYMAKFDHINFFSSPLFDPEQIASEEIQKWAKISARYGSVRCLTLFLDLLGKRKQLPLLGRIPLFESVYFGQKKAADLILHKILDPNLVDSEGTTAAHLAVVMNDKQMVKLLLERGALFHKLNQTGSSALHFAVYWNRKKILNYLLNPARKIQVPENLLHSAAARGSPELLDLFLKEQFSDINALDPDKREPPLLWAVRANHVSNVHYLCRRGASLNVKSRSGETPLLCAAKQNNEILGILLHYHPPYQMTERGENALHLAAMQGHEEQVALLLKHGFDPNIRDNRGKTPLMHAREGKFFNVCALLSGEKEQLEKNKQDLVRSLKEGDFDQFFELAKNFPPNRAIPFTLPHIGKASFPILHLIDLLVSKKEEKKKLLEKWVEKHPKDRSVKTKEGQTLLHLAAIRDQDPPLKKMDPLSLDRNEVSPLHLFAQSNSLERFQSVFSEISCAQKDKKNESNIRDKNAESPIFYAIKKNRIEIVSFLLDNGARISARSSSFMTLLGLAVEKNSLPIVRLLVSRGACLEDRSGLNGETALHIAAREGFHEIAQFLVENTTNLYQKDYCGREPIHLAAANGNLNMVRFLYACGASLFSVDFQGNGLAYFAAQSESQHLIDFLKERNVPLDPSKSETIQPKQAPLHMAAKQGSLPMLAQFALHRANFEVRDSDQNTSLFYATMSRNPEVLELFSQSPLMDEIEQVYRSIVLAIGLDSVSQLRILQRELTQINQPLEPIQGVTALHLASLFGSLRVANHLLKEGADPSVTLFDGTPPFEWAVFYDRVEVARVLASKLKIDPNQRLSKGNYYLHLAAMKGSDAMAAFLYQEGATLDVCDNEGNTALHCAAKKDHLKTMKLLLALGAKPGIKNFKNETPRDLLENKESRALVASYEKKLALCEKYREGRLHAAVRLGEPCAFSILAEEEDLYQKNSQGQTPLHLAVLEKNVSLLRRLLELDIDPDLEVRDNRGDTPLSLAMREGQHSQVAQLLHQFDSFRANV